MIIFSGWGPLALIVYVVSFFIIALPFNAISSHNSTFNDILLVLDALISAYVTYKVGLWFKNRKAKTYIDPDTYEEVVLREKHSFMGIPFEYVGFVIAAFFSILFIINMFDPKGDNSTDSNQTISEIIDKYGLEKAERKCENGDADACSNVGYEYAKGNIVEEDSKKAIAYFKKACDGNSGMGCNNLGIMYETDENISISAQEIFSIYKKSCDLSYTDGCANVAERYLTGGGIKIDVEKGTKLADQACNKKSEIGCNALAEYYELTKQYPQSLSYYEKACSLGDARACSDAGVFYNEGRGVALNEVKAFELNKQACDLNIDDGGSSCFMTGLDYAIGELVPEDKNKEHEYYDKACKDGHEKACVREC